MKFKNYEVVEEEVVLHEKDGDLIDEYGNRYDYDDYGNLCRETVEDETTKKVAEKVEEYNNAEIEGDITDEKAKKSGYELKMLKYTDIAVAKRLREESMDNHKAEMNRSLGEYGIIQPLLVVPYENKYLLIDGYRRLVSAGIMRIEELPCVVNYNLRVDNKVVAEAMANEHEPYTMAEKLNIVHKLAEDNTIEKEEIEELAQLQENDLEKIDIIENAKDGTLIEKVGNEKMTIDKAYKMALKEDEPPKEPKPEEEPEVPDVDMNINKLDPVDEKFKQKILERDKYTCACCGVEGDVYNNVVEPHLIVPKIAGGKEKDNNAITVCNRCHKQIHLYSVDKLEKPDLMTEEELGSMEVDEVRAYEKKVELYENIEEYGKKLKKSIEDAKVDKVAVEQQTEQVGGTESVEM